MLEEIDALETREWLDALESVIKHGGSERAAFCWHNWQTQQLNPAYDYRLRSPPLLQYHPCRP